jgi:hypothetical protein
VSMRVLCHVHISLREEFASPDANTCSPHLQV